MYQASIDSVIKIWQDAADDLPPNPNGSYADWKPELTAIGLAAGKKIASNWQASRGSDGSWAASNVKSIRERKRDAGGDDATLEDTSRLLQGASGAFQGAPYSAYALRKTALTMGPDAKQVPYAAVHNRTPNAEVQASGQVNRPYLTPAFFEKEMAGYIKAVIKAGILKRLQAAGLLDWNSSTARLGTFRGPG